MWYLVMFINMMMEGFLILFVSSSFLPKVSSEKFSTPAA